jgi:hypothetical protein
MFLDTGVERVSDTKYDVAAWLKNKSQRRTLHHRKMSTDREKEKDKKDREATNAHGLPRRNITMQDALCVHVDATS